MVCRRICRSHSRRRTGLWKMSFARSVRQTESALKIFLDTQMGAPKLIEAKAQFNTVGCAGCHTVGTFGGDAGVNLSLSGFKDPNQLNFSKVPGDHTSVELDRPAFSFTRVDGRRFANARAWACLKTRSTC